MSDILLLDSNSLMNRAFYALPILSNKDGVYTNAVYGYLSMLARLLNEKKFTHIAAVFDVKAPTFRHLRYDKYKGTRKPMPEELVPQMPLLKELLVLLGVKVVEKAGYEADDIIGTLAKKCAFETVIVSGDRDVLQLVDDSTVVYNTKRGVTDIKVYDENALAEDGFTPEQVIEYKALSGDASDNIPGCPGVGEKTAKALLADYGDVDGVYAHIDEIKGKLRERLIENKESVYLSRELATIKTDVPLEVTEDELTFSGNVPQAFCDKLIELECKTLIPRFTKLAAGVSEKIKGLTPLETLPDIEIKSEVTKVNAVNINSESELEAVLNGKKEGLSLVLADNIHFSLDGKTEYIIETAHDLLSEGMSFDDAVAHFKPLFESDIPKVFFDVKNLMHELDVYGITFAKPYDDALLMNYLLDVTKTPKSVGELIENYGYTEPASGILELKGTLLTKLKLSGLDDLYNNIELPLVEVLFSMEKCGFKVDLSVLNELAERYTAEINAIADEIFAMNGNEKFNINSPQQLGTVLFEKLGLQHGKKTKTGYSVAADILEELDHPIIPLILKYKKFGKLLSTYINGMRAVMEPSTCKVHTVFKQCLTQTGRLSSTEPNLQNIPIRTEEGREIRRMFVPSARDRALVSADYSQIELRLLAHFSGDPILTSAYNSGEDIHAITASKIYGVPLESVTSKMRRDAKRVNFGIIYGMSAFGLANAVGTSPYEARIFQDKYFESYPKVKSYMQGNVDFAVKNGYIRTLEGRIRYFPEFKSANKNIRNFGERAAMNMPLQGSASDIIKIAMLKVYKALKDGGYKSDLILQVHDELVLDVPKDEVEAVKKLLVECMESAAKLNVPLIADAKVGADWYSVE